MVKENGASGLRPVAVLQKCVQVLDCFSPEQAHLTVAQVKHATGMPLTTVVRLMASLAANDLLRREGDTYRVGHRVLAWSTASTSGSDLIRLAAPYVTELRDTTGETSALFVRYGLTRVALLSEQSHQSIIFRGYAGQVFPLTSGAAAKVFLAYDESALDMVRSDPLSSSTPGIANRAALEAQLQNVREHGWAFASDEREPGLASLAAPVFDRTGEVAAVLAVGGPSFRLTKTYANTYGPIIAATTETLSRALGHQPTIGRNEHP